MGRGKDEEERGQSCESLVCGPAAQFTECYAPIQVATAAVAWYCGHRDGGQGVLTTLCVVVGFGNGNSFLPMAAKAG